MLSQRGGECRGRASTEKHCRGRFVKFCDWWARGQKREWLQPPLLGRQVFTLGLWVYWVQELRLSINRGRRRCPCFQTLGSRCSGRTRYPTAPLHWHSVLPFCLSLSHLVLCFPEIITHAHLTVCYFMFLSVPFRNTKLRQVKTWRLVWFGMWESVVPMLSVYIFKSLVKGCQWKPFPLCLNIWKPLVKVLYS